MAQRTIYLPPDLDLEVEKHRDKLNISQICAAALRQAVKQVAPTQPLKYAALVVTVEGVTPLQLTRWRGSVRRAGECAAEILGIRRKGE